MTKKLLSFLVAALMVLSIVPMAAFASSASRVPAPAPVKEEQVALWNFDNTAPLDEGWLFVDADGDGYNWERSSLVSAHSGTYMIASASYDGGARTPDNWAITPAVNLPNAEQASLRYFVKGYSANYPETYRIYVGASTNIESMQPVTEDMQTATDIDWHEQVVDLSAYAGETVYIAFRHYNCTDQWRFFIDDVEVFTGESGTTPTEPPVTEPPVTEPPVTEPPAEGLIEGFYFENQAEVDEWTFVDSDGDNNNWYWLAFGINQEVANMAYEGVGNLTSASYQGAALTPDNWAISPAVEIPAGGSVSMYIGAQDPSWSDEHFAVYVGIGNDVSAYEMISEELVSTGAYARYEFDLSEYAGQTVSIAIRHFNCTDMFRINLDQVEIWGEGGTTPTEPPVTEPPVTEPPVTNPPAGDLIAGYYFETEAEVNEWTFIGANDTNWVWSDNNPGGYDYTVYAHEGSRFILSYSFVDYVGAYQADNWAISPAVTLPSGASRVSFYASNANADYPETFSVYIGNTPDTASMTLLQGNINAPSGYDEPWTHYEIDLSEYAGQTIYLAFYDNCYDCYEVWIDQVEFFGEGGSQPGEPIVIDTIEIENFVAPAWGEAPFYDVTVPADAHYSVVYTDWNWWDYDLDDGDVLAPTALFDNPNYAYYQYFDIVPDEGYTFSDATEIKLNGDASLIETAGWSVNDSTFWAYTVDFLVEEPVIGVLGDVDLDGEVTTADALLALRYIMGLIELNEDQLAQADVNGDGEVTISDALNILRFAIGVIEVFPNN